jgi:hypothetical protein
MSFERATPGIGLAAEAAAPPPEAADADLSLAHGGRVKRAARGGPSRRRLDVRRPVRGLRAVVLHEGRAARTVLTEPPVPSASYS